MLGGNCRPLPAALQLPTLGPVEPAWLNLNISTSLKNGLGEGLLHCARGQQGNSPPAFRPGGSFWNYSILHSQPLTQSQYVSAFSKLLEPCFLSQLVSRGQSACWPARETEVSCPATPCPLSITPTQGPVKVPLLPSADMFSS